MLGGLDLLADDDLEPLDALALGLQRAGDLVVVGDRDRAEAAGAGLGEQDLHGGGAVRRVVGVHVQIDVDQRPLASAAAAATGSPTVIVAAGRPARLVELSPTRRRRRGPSPAPRAADGVGPRRLPGCGRSAVCRCARPASPPPRARRSASPGPRRRGSRHRPAARAGDARSAPEPSACNSVPGVGRSPSDANTATSAVGQDLGLGRQRTRRR